MGSETPLKLPAIDFSKENLNPGTEEWNSVRSQIFKAVQEYGCFEAIYKKVPFDLKKNIIGAIEELFDLPLETKMKNVSKTSLHGYLGQFPGAPLYESMAIDGVNVPEIVETMTNTMWPQGNSSFSETVQSYSIQLSKLDQIIRRMILESLSVEKYLEEHLNSTNYLLRMIKYNGPDNAEAEIGLHPHTDKTILTILHQNQINGLEVKSQNGEWINVKFSPESFIVFTGDAFNAWTNGRVYSPCHRVMMSGNVTRYSAGLFAVPKAGYIIKAPEELIDEQHPLLFKPYDYVEFLAFYSTEAGLTAQNPLKAYCGA